MAKIIVDLRPSEKDALRLLSARERRDPKDQAAIIIRRELEQSGLLLDKPAKPEPLAKESPHATPTE